METQRKTYKRWTDNEVQALLSIYAEDDIQRELKRWKKVYAKVFAKLAKLD